MERGSIRCLKVSMTIRYPMDRAVYGGRAGKRLIAREKETKCLGDPLAKLGTKWGWRVLAGVGCPVFWRTNCLLRSSIVGPAYPHTIYWGLKIDTFPGSACLSKVLCAFSSIPPV